MLRSGSATFLHTTLGRFPMFLRPGQPSAPSVSAPRRPFPLPLYKAIASSERTPPPFAAAALVLREGKEAGGGAPGGRSTYLEGASGSPTHLGMAAALLLPGVALESVSVVRAVSRLGRELYSVCGAARPGGQCWRRRGLVAQCQSGAAILKKDEAAPASAARDGEKAAAGFTVVMKFGGSSLASADRMREVADLVISFLEERPVVVLSAMGKTTNNLLLAGEKAVGCGAPKVSEIDELAVIKDLHLRMIDELGLDRSTI